MDITVALGRRTELPVRVSGQGDTLYLRVGQDGRSQKLEEIALFVDTSVGGLRMRDHEGNIELLAMDIDALRVERVPAEAGTVSYLIELTALWRTGAGPDVRRSLCRYFVEREHVSG